MNKQDYFKEFLPSWINSDGEASDVALSSRVRLARNFKGIPFPNVAKDSQLGSITEEISRVIREKPPLEPLALIKVEELTPNDRFVLVEKHLCSPQFIERPHLRMLLVNQEQSISVMINEEDHLRIQALTPGFSLEGALTLANQVDDYLEENLDISFDERYGYLTACPTNAGTGLRASVMLHLPGLAIVDQVKKVLSALTHIGISIRGLYGEGTESLGDIYQISNSVTLGRNEVELNGNLKSVCRQVIERERAVREALLKDSKIQLEDRVCRSYGLLSQARMLTSQEALKLLSDVKLGVELGIIPGINKTTVKALMFMIRASILQKIAGKELSPAERDYYRASLLRDKFKNNGV
ncbi:MAG: protein arginine kinase [Bacillota bacterium]